MRRGAIICAEHLSAGFGLAFALAPHQGFDPAFQRGDLIRLLCDDAAEIIDNAFEMSDFFFQLFHEGYMRRARGLVKALLAPARALR